MREAGVPDEQLVPVAGGERVPLFTAAQRKEAIDRAPKPGSGPPGPPRGPPGPPLPTPSSATINVHIWPALHCLMPQGDHNSFPETMDTGTVYTGGASHTCTLDITRGMTYGLGGLIKLPVIPPMVQGEMRAFVEYMRDKDLNKYSYFDGGQLMFNFLLGDKTLLWNGYLGGYEGVLRGLEPKPDVAILAIAGRANHNGRPWNGSSAEYARNLIKWIGEPKEVIWCLHDKGAINPKYIDTKAATKLVESDTKTKVIELEHTVVHKVFH